MDILISNLLLELILDFGKWSNGKYRNTLTPPPILVFVYILFVSATIYGQIHSLEVKFSIPRRHLFNAGHFITKHYTGKVPKRINVHQFRMF